MFSFRRLIGRLIGFVGGFSRWVVGTIWRTLFRKQKYKLRDYVHGIHNPKDFLRGMDHAIANYLVGLTVIIALFWLVSFTNELI